MTHEEMEFLSEVAHRAKNPNMLKSILLSAVGGVEAEAREAARQAEAEAREKARIDRENQRKAEAEAREKAQIEKELKTAESYHQDFLQVFAKKLSPHRTSRGAGQALL